MHQDQNGFIPRMSGWFNICKSKDLIFHVNKMKDKNYMIISTHEEKASEQNPTSFTTKIFSKGGMDGPPENNKSRELTSPQLTSYSTVKS